MGPPIRIGIVGLGKISQAQHLPVVDNLAEFEIAFLADRAVKLDRPEPWFASLESALSSGIEFDAVALCTSPQPRLELCEALSERGCAILLEKPAAANFEQARTIARIATERNIPLMTGWHSQFAPAVSEAKSWLETQTLVSGSIEWRENANKWHPGQDWLWREGGYGVFDPGMNALSILSALLQIDWDVSDAVLNIPNNVETADRAAFVLNCEKVRISAEFEFHDKEAEIWQISLLTQSGDQLLISEGGANAAVNGVPLVAATSQEYENLYHCFSTVTHSRQSLIDLRPLRIIEQVYQTARIVRSAEIDVVTTPRAHDQG